MRIICPFCEENAAIIDKTKKIKDGKRFFYYYCSNCRSKIFFPKPYREELFQTLLDMLEINNVDVKYMIPATNQYKCIICGKNTTNVKKTKKGNMIYFWCFTCLSTMFISEKHFDKLAAVTWNPD